MTSVSGTGRGGEEGAFEVSEFLHTREFKLQVIEHLMRIDTSVGCISDVAVSGEEDWTGRVARAYGQAHGIHLPSMSPVWAVFCGGRVSELWRESVGVAPGSVYAEYLDLLKLSGQERYSDPWEQYCELITDFA